MGAKARKPVRLASWRGEKGRAKELKAAGYSVLFDPLDGGRLLAALKKDPPGAVVIDLCRSPAQGRDLGIALGVFGATRQVPVSAGDSPEKVKRVQEVLLDAVFASWPRVAKPLGRALAFAVVRPVIPESVFAGYSGTPLPKKLGMMAGTKVLLAGAPEGFADTLGDLPKGANLIRRYGKAVGLILGSPGGNAGHIRR